MMPEVGVDPLTMLDVSPPDFVSIAGEAGFDSVSIRVEAASRGEERWPLDLGSAMLKETVRRLEQTGMRTLTAEVARLRPDTASSHYERTLEVAARLGARYLLVNSDDPEIDRARENFAALSSIASQYGLRPLIEPITYTQASNLDDAIKIAADSGGGILIDALHFHRSGGRPEQLRAVDPGLLPLVQLCDAPLAPPVGLPRPRSLPGGQSTDGSDLQLESRAMRLLPGDGELPLRELLDALPDDIPVSVEAPVLSLRETVSETEFARRARRSVENLLPRPANAGGSR